MKITRMVNNEQCIFELTKQELFEANKEFIINYMKDTLEYDFRVNKNVSLELAEQAYEIYSDGNGYTEYESIEQAYEEYQKELEKD